MGSPVGGGRFSPRLGQKSGGVISLLGCQWATLPCPSMYLLILILKSQPLWFTYLFFFFFLMSEMIYLSRFTGVIKQSSEEDLYHGPST